MSTEELLGNFIMWGNSHVRRLLAEKKINQKQVNEMADVILKNENFSSGMRVLAKMLVK